MVKRTGSPQQAHSLAISKDRASFLNLPCTMGVATASAPQAALIRSPLRSAVVTPEHSCRRVQRHACVTTPALGDPTALVARQQRRVPTAIEEQQNLVPRRDLFDNHANHDRREPSLELHRADIDEINLRR